MTRHGSDWEWVPCPRDAMRVVTLSNDTRAQGRNGGWMGGLSLSRQGLWVCEEISALIPLFVILKSQTFKERIKICFL